MKRITRKEYHKFEMESFLAQKGLWNLVRENPEGKRRVAKGRR